MRRWNFPSTLKPLLVLESMMRTGSQESNFPLFHVKILNVAFSVSFTNFSVLAGVKNFSSVKMFLRSSVGTRRPSPTSVYFFLHFLVKNYHKKGKPTSFLLFVQCLMYLPEPELQFCPTAIKNASARHAGWQVASLWGTWALLFILRRSLIHHPAAHIYYHQLSCRRFLWSTICPIIFKHSHKRSRRSTQRAVPRCGTKGTASRLFHIPESRV